LKQNGGNVGIKRLAVQEMLNRAERLRYRQDVLVLVDGCPFPPLERMRAAKTVLFLRKTDGLSVEALDVTAEAHEGLLYEGFLGDENED